MPTHLTPEQRAELRIAWSGIDAAMAALSRLPLGAIPPADRWQIEAWWDECDTIMPLLERLAAEGAAGQERSE